jgi:homoserine dehydrogenase
MADKIRVGIAGFGTVGAGVAKIILENADAIKARTGIELELASVVDLDTTTKRPVDLPAGILTDDMDALLNDDSIDVAVELIGGTDFARDLHLKMLSSGKHVVTANKALLAKHGGELYKAARENNKCIAFEASCAGGIPIVSAIRTGLAANNIRAIYGILNGTCNYILTSMTSDGVDFADILKEAQDKGYAEADPALDINGGDTAHKLAILGSLAFGSQIELDDIHIEGIENIKLTDIKYGCEMGYVLKLLAIGERSKSGKISLRVHPSFLSKDNPLARVDGSFNAVSIYGHAVGHTMYYGRGAGMMPTASAVVADIIEVAMGNSANLFNAQTIESREETVASLESMDNVVSRYYIRLLAKDVPGTVARYAQILGDNGISISGVLQHEEHNVGTSVGVIVTTHPAEESKINAALKTIKELDVIDGEPVCIRIVEIPEDDLED